MNTYFLETFEEVDQVQDGGCDRRFWICMMSKTKPGPPGPRVALFTPTVGEGQPLKVESKTLKIPNRGDLCL